MIFIKWFRGYYYRFIKTKFNDYVKSDNRYLKKMMCAYCNWSSFLHNLIIVNLVIEKLLSSYLLYAIVHVLLIASLNWTCGFGNWIRHVF